MPVKLLAQRARKWLNDISGPALAGRNLQYMVFCIIGIHLCDVLENTPDNGSSRETLNRIADGLRQSDSETLKDKIGAVKLLLCLKILSYQGFAQELLTQISREYGELFLQIGSPVPLQFKAIQVFLYDMGLIKAAPKAAAIVMEDLCTDPLEILRMSKVRLAEICEYINSACIHGTGDGLVMSDPGSDPALLLIRLLIPVMMQRFRENDLETGTMILRSLNYLGMQKKVILDTVLNFIVGQQQSGGGFGFQPQISKFVNNEKALSPDISIANTISCLWSIAETNDPGFRLFSVFRIGAGVADSSKKNGRSMRRTILQI